mmetsp:Transcript_8720/g.21450  ORF Transcript_8720/g.21450 Transcript_8720/m.21450 type:complete len:103 (+) Transcript_8720:2475-2783(+)
MSLPGWQIAHDTFDDTLNEKHVFNDIGNTVCRDFFFGCIPSFSFEFLASRFGGTTFACQSSGGMRRVFASRRMTKTEHSDGMIGKSMKAGMNDVHLFMICVL